MSTSLNEHFTEWKLRWTKTSLNEYLPSHMQWGLKNTTPYLASLASCEVSFPITSHFTCLCLALEKLRTFGNIHQRKKKKGKRFGMVSTCDACTSELFAFLQSIIRAIFSIKANTVELGFALSCSLASLSVTRSREPPSAVTYCNSRQHISRLVLILGT